ncbi:DUF4398 domain-containing protein [Hydrogenophaga soli]
MSIPHASTRPAPTPHGDAPHRPVLQRGWRGLWIVTPALIWACASKVPIPSEPLAMAQAAVTSAASAGAAEWAPTELQLARDKLSRAKVAATEEHNLYATHLARESHADANLAEVKARSLKAQKTAGELGEGNRVLRDELQRSVKP